MKNPIDILNKFRLKHYKKSMEQMLEESELATRDCDNERSAILYQRYLHYKHLYIKAGGEM